MKKKDETKSEKIRRHGENVLEGILIPIATPLAIPSSIKKIKNTVEDYLKYYTHNTVSENRTDFCLAIRDLIVGSVTYPPLIEKNIGIAVSSIFLINKYQGICSLIKENPYLLAIPVITNLASHFYEKRREK